MTETTQPISMIPKQDVQPLLEELSTWGKVTTIVIHKGSVFEFKGEFPEGSVAHGFFNLSNNGSGFEGHININSIKNVTFQDKLHRGSESYAFVFNDSGGEPVFKVFIGRDAHGHLLEDQKQAFLHKQLQYKA